MGAAGDESQQDAGRRADRKSRRRAEQARAGLSEDLARSGEFDKGFANTGGRWQIVGQPAELSRRLPEQEDRQRDDKPGGTSGDRAHQSLTGWTQRSEEHTSELQSRRDLVCRLLLEKKK